MVNRVQSIITKLEEAIILIILSCIKELEIKVGINKLTAILIGSQSNYIFENKFNENSFYGFLQNYNSNQIQEIINRLYELGLIKSSNIDEDYYTSVIDLTQKGFKSIYSLSVINPYFFKKIIKVNKSDLDIKSKNIFYRLRVIRQEIAQSIGKPAFIVCSDKVLREIAKQKPTDVSSLLKINGIGNHFIEKYSDLFLNELELIAA